MERHQIGIVKELYRYPVKSLLGERLSQFDAATEGVIGDRAWALIDESDGRVMSAKKFRTMLELRAAYIQPPNARGSIAPRITLPGGEAVDADDPRAAEMIGSLLNCRLKLTGIEPAQKRRAGIDPATIFSDLGISRILPHLSEDTMPPEFTLLRGSFFDSARIHVLTTGTIAHLRSLIGPDARIDARRFRPNIVVETPPEARGFVEDEWLNGRLEVGDSVCITSMEPALRCVMTTHPQEDLPKDPRVLRATADHHRAKLGVFAAIGYPGTVRVGDPVWLAV